MRTVAVFFGGNSNEREISVITGMLAVNLLRSAARYRVLPVYLAEDGGMYTSREMNGVGAFREFSPKRHIPLAFSKGRLVRADKRNKTVSPVDCALNCCHGGMGEDGTLSALWKWYGIRSASPDTAVSAVFMQKQLGKIAAAGLGIPVLPSVTVQEGERAEAEKRAEALGYPLIVKPSRLGSSIGVTVVKNKGELKDALDLAFYLDDAALIEKYLEGKRDINVALCRRGGDVVVSPCEEAFSGGEILSFSEKYEETGARRSALPAKLPEGVAEKIASYARRLYAAFRVRGVVRADFLFAGEEVYFNELNTVPGSLACYLFGERLVQSRDFLVSLVEEALRTPEEEKPTVRTGILASDVFRGAKGCKARKNSV